MQHRAPLTLAYWLFLTELILGIFFFFFFPLFTGYYKPAQVRDCFREIPLNPDIKTATLEAVANLSLIYSYTDLLRNSGPPYHTNVRRRLFSSNHDF
jgi:hypothetical protein